MAEALQLPSLPPEVLQLIVSKLDAVGAVRLVECTCKQLCADVDRMAFWQRLAADARIATTDRDGAPLSLVALRRSYSRRVFHQRGACARCGSQVRGRTQSVVDSVPLDGPHMHLCAWLVDVTTPRPAQSAQPYPSASQCVVAAG